LLRSDYAIGSEVIADNAAGPGDSFGALLWKGTTLPASELLMFVLPQSNQSVARREIA